MVSSPASGRSSGATPVPVFPAFGESSASKLCSSTFLDPDSAFSAGLGGLRGSLLGVRQLVLDEALKMA